MRFTIPAINNDYYDEDYLKAFPFKAMGKNVRVHRSVVFMEPSKVSIGSNVTIEPYCVFGNGPAVVADGATINSFAYYASVPEADAKSAEERVKELEALLAEKQKNDGRTNDAS